MKNTFLFICLLIPFIGFNQSIKYISEEIKIDGETTESIWSSPSEVHSFTQTFPSDTLPSKYKMEVRFASDNENLYIFGKCFFNPEILPYVQTLKRDFNAGANDAFGVYFDPYNDKQNGFYFEVNALGSQGEGTVRNGGWTSGIWDQKWYSSTKIYKDYWIAEMRIPFKSIRYSEEIDAWNFNVGRTYINANEYSAWVPIPRNFDYGALVFTKPITFEKRPPKPKKNIAIIPSITGNASIGYDSVTTTNNNLLTSLDAKITVTPSLNLDLTINPDFSQAEVDVQQSLDRFELFFPERRQFFIENSDLFSEFGFRQIRPFFSRRIGLRSGTVIPILGGARLSGRLNDNWRIGLMNMQTRQNQELNLDGENYTVAAFQRKVFDRSNIAGILVNRQGFNGNSINYSDYNRVAGVDFNIASANNRWQGKIFQHHSFTSNSNKVGIANASWLMRSTRKWFFMWNHEYVDKNYNAESGFVPRNKRWDPINNKQVGLSYFRLEPSIRYNMYPAKGKINRHGPEIYWNYYTDDKFKPTDMELYFSYLINFNNNSSLKLRHARKFTRLYYPTDISFSENPILAAGNYDYGDASIEYASDNRKPFTYSMNARTGNFYTGTAANFWGNIGYRFLPKTSFSLNFQKSIINLPSYKNPASVDLYGFITDISFTSTMFFKSFVQYNSQSESIDHNARFQWRFRPMSDFYIVYSDFYDVHLNADRRTLAIKFIYWITA